jgi:hypothetical protein
MYQSVILMMDLGEEYGMYGLVDSSKAASAYLFLPLKGTDLCGRLLSPPGGRGGRVCGGHDGLCHLSRRWGTSAGEGLYRWYYRPME